MKGCEFVVYEVSKVLILTALVVASEGRGDRRGGRSVDFRADGAIWRELEKLPFQPDSSNFLLQKGPFEAGCEVISHKHHQVEFHKLSSGTTSAFLSNPNSVTLRIHAVGYIHCKYHCSRYILKFRSGITRVN